MQTTLQTNALKPHPPSSFFFFSFFLFFRNGTITAVGNISNVSCSRHNRQTLWMRYLFFFLFFFFCLSFFQKERSRLLVIYQTYHAPNTTDKRSTFFIFLVNGMITAVGNISNVSCSRHYRRARWIRHPPSFYFLSFYSYSSFCL